MNAFQQLQQVIDTLDVDRETLSRKRKVTAKNIALSNFGLESVVLGDSRLEFQVANITKQEKQVQSVFYVVLFCVSSEFRALNTINRDLVMLKLYTEYKWPLDLVGLLNLFQINCLSFLSCETGLQKRETRRAASIRALKEPELGLQQPSGYRVSLQVKRHDNRPYIFLLTDGNERYSPIFYVDPETKEQVFLMPYELGRDLEAKVPEGPCLKYQRGAFVRFDEESWQIVSVNDEDGSYTLERLDDETKEPITVVVTANKINASTAAPSGQLEGSVFVDDRYVLYAYEKLADYIESLQRREIET